MGQRRGGVSLTSSRAKRRTDPLPPLDWSWSDAASLMFESTTPPDRLLREDVGPGSDPENFQAWCMKKALLESAERMAQLLNEAGLTPADVAHLDPNRNRPNAVEKYLQDEIV